MSLTRQILTVILFVTSFALRSYGQNDTLVDDSATVPLDFGWPRQVVKDSVQLVYHQPQLDTWDNFKLLKGRMAFSINTRSRAAMGVCDIQAKTQVDKEAHTVVFRKIEITEVRIAGLNNEALARAKKHLNDLLPKEGEPIALERLTAELKQDELKVKGVQLMNDPPVIFYSESAAILLMVDGLAVRVPIDSSGMDFIVNTNWDLFYDKASAQYYLLADEAWLTSKELDKNWTPTKNLPTALTKLPSGQNFESVKQFIPPPKNPVVPKVLYSNVPAELIAVNGQAMYVKIPGTGLMYIDNTDYDVFAEKSSGKHYVLISGRWFSTKDITKGPWVYAGDQLPSDFAKIPKDSPRARVLYAVPGTTEASDAVLLAQIPTMAEVNKKEASKKVKVMYDGEPQFKPIEGTQLFYATNTQEKVIKLGEKYYVCYQGVWFFSSDPKGPWVTAESVPQEIYSIPPSSPLYNVTYVTQTNVSDTHVECCTHSGYYGMYPMGVSFGVCMTFGTGFYYPPYMYYPPGMYYPYYRPYPYSYGGAYYNPYSGTYGRGGRVYGPYGSAGTAAWHNPSTGRYGRAASVQAGGSGRTVAGAYNPYTGGYARTSQGHNTYGQWGNTVASKGGQTIQTGHVTTDRGTAAGYRTSGGKSGAMVQGDRGTVVKSDKGVYAGNDGNVYRRNDNGSWSKYNNETGGWQDAGGRGNSAEQLPAKGQGNAGNDRPSAEQRPMERQGGSRESANTPQQTSADRAGNNTGQSNRGMSENTSRDLNNSANSRQRGQTQTDRFQNSQRMGAGGGRGFGGGGGGRRR